MFLPVLLLLACPPRPDSQDDTGHECGPGTHWDGEYCVPDADTDTDTDTDADSDTDADTDADTDTDTDPADADGDGFTVGEGDCDDGDADVHPGAEEVCGNGVDDDCDGTPNDCGWSGSYDLGDDGYQLLGDHELDLAGYMLDAHGDGNGDSVPDLLVGAPRGDPGASSAGIVYVVEGPITVDSELDSAPGILNGAVTDGQAGSAVSWTGDFDADGFDDVLVGAPYAGVSGVAYLVRGPITGEVSLAGADASWSGTAAARVGWAVQDLGDVSGDGLPDIAVGAPEDDVRVNEGGAVYLFFDGGALGARTTSEADAQIHASDDHLCLGRALAEASDLNGDGVGDLALGGSMAVWVFEGPVTGIQYETSADAKLFPHSPREAMVYYSDTVAGGGDANGDGYGDLLIGAPEANTSDTLQCDGAAWLVEGPVSGDLDMFFAAAKVEGGIPNTWVGYSVDFAGDVDGDGGDDLLIGAPAHDYYSGNSGSAHLFLSGASGTLGLEDADASFYGTGTEDFGGWCVRGAGDLTGDGLPDLAIASVKGDGEASQSGVVFLLPGFGI